MDRYPRRESAAPARRESVVPPAFGFIVSLREDYGFIQPLLAKDHVYFDRKEGDLQYLSYFI